MAVERLSRSPQPKKPPLRGLLPVVIDVETGGLNPETDALLEIALVPLHFDPDTEHWHPKTTHHQHIVPHPETQLHAASLAINRIIPDHPFRYAVDECTALREAYAHIEAELASQPYHRAVLVGHNAAFDLAFLHAATARHAELRSPLHAFTTLDTATLSAAVYGETVLARALYAAGIAFNPDAAHSAIYDAEKTAALFCQLMNHIRTQKNQLD